MFLSVAAEDNGLFGLPCVASVQRLTLDPKSSFSLLGDPHHPLTDVSPAGSILRLSTHREGAEMTTANATPMYRKLSDPQLEVDAEIRHVRDLVYLRGLLAERGATMDELRQYDAAIAERRSELARSVKRAAGYAAAA
jgi:hypothetical protein